MIGDEGEPLRRALAAEAEQVAPSDGLARIQARVAARRRPWWRRVWGRLASHGHDWQGDPIAPDDVRCRICGQRPCKNGAPAGPGTPPNPTAVKEPKDMETVPREAQELRPDDIITRHPDHPGRKVWYRVARWPRRVSHAQVLVDYTARPEQVDGETSGVLVLDVDQECQVVPAHTQGGQA